MVFSNFQIFIFILSAIILFLHALDSFSHEVKLALGRKIQTGLERFANNQYNAFFLGSLFTAIVQSSSAVIGITITLVEAKILSLRSSLGLMIGSNVGTTFTAWMVTLKLTGIGPFFIVLGGVMSYMSGKPKVFGKAIFYFGFIFYSLYLIDLSLEPIKQAPNLKNYMLMVNTPLLALALGTLATAVVQSSSVVTGTLVVLLQQNMIPFDSAVYIMLGSNLGTTAKALLISARFGITAKKAAIANIVLNLSGVLLFLPFMVPFASWVSGFTQDPAKNLAISHVIFNLSTGLPFLIFVGYYEKIVNWIYNKVDRRES